MKDLEGLDEEKYLIRLQNEVIDILKELNYKEIRGTGIEDLFLDRVTKVYKEKVLDSKQESLIKKSKGFASKYFQEFVKNELKVPQKTRFETILGFVFNAGKFGGYAKTKDFLSLLVGYKGYLNFIEAMNAEEASQEALEETTNPVQEKKTGIPSIANDNSSKAKVLDTFFEKACYLYVFDQDIADSRSKKRGASIDAVVIKRQSRDSWVLDISNIDTGKKVHYKDGVLEWADEERKTFNIVFDSHRRNLYMRFHFCDFGSEVPELILGKLIFSMGTKRKVTTGSAILARQPEIENKTPYSYDFRLKKAGTPVPPKEIQAYLFDKSYNFQKTPPEIFTHAKLRDWFELKFGNRVTHDTIRYDYLITYPGSSFENEQDQNELFTSIETILKNGIQPEKKRTNEDRFIQNVNNYLQLHYHEDRSKTGIVVFPRIRENHFNARSGDNEAFNTEIVDYVRRSSNIIIVVPRATYKRPSSVFIFAGLSMLLDKRVFIFYQDEDQIPAVFQKNCTSMGVFTFQFEDLNRIPLDINQELRHKRNTRKKS